MVLRIWQNHIVKDHCSREGSSCFCQLIWSSSQHRCAELGTLLLPLRRLLDSFKPRAIIPTVQIFKELHSAGSSPGSESCIRMDTFEQNIGSAGAFFSKHRCKEICLGESENVYVWKGQWASKRNWTQNTFSVSVLLPMLQLLSVMLSLQELSWPADLRWMSEEMTEQC